ncbi:MAG: VOC family protein [Vicinamibacterales bacterium]
MTSQEPTVVGDFQGHEIYPMPMFATIAVADVTAVSGWYQQALGFTVVFAAPGAALVHLRRRKYQDLLIMPTRAGAATGSPVPTLTVSFSADGEIDELAARAHAAPSLGASAVAGPVATPWNTVDLRVTDPAGHQLIFTARDPNPDPEQARRMQAMFDAPRKANTLG